MKSWVHYCQLPVSVPLVHRIVECRRFRHEREKQKEHKCALSSSVV